MAIRRANIYKIVNLLTVKSQKISTIFLKKIPLPAQFFCFPFCFPFRKMGV
jgi:hypothetical protein